MHQKRAGLLQIGYSVANDPQLRLLDFWIPASGVARDGRWSCSPEENSYPALQHSLVHPCAGTASSSGTPGAPLVNAPANVLQSLTKPRGTAMLRLVER